MVMERGGMGRTSKASSGCASRDCFGDFGAKQPVNMIESGEDVDESGTVFSSTQKDYDEESSGVGGREDFFDDQLLQEGIATLAGKCERKDASHLFAESGGFVVGFFVSGFVVENRPERTARFGVVGARIVPARGVVKAHVGSPCAQYEPCRIAPNFKKSSNT